MRYIPTFLLVLLVSLSGCGNKSELKRVEVKGTVLLNGEPLKDGLIRMIPVEGSKNPRSVAKVENGQFYIDNLGGVAAGTYQVEVLGFRTETTVEDGETVENRIQFLPPEYNKKTKLTLTIPEDSRLVEEKFELQADPQKSYF
jgi:hypothetical protein